FTLSWSLLLLFSTASATIELFTLSLHDALPILRRLGQARGVVVPVRDHQMRDGLLESAVGAVQFEQPAFSGAPGGDEFGVHAVVPRDAEALRVLPHVRQELGARGV